MSPAKARGFFVAVICHLVPPAAPRRPVTIARANQRAYSYAFFYALRIDTYYALCITLSNSSEEAPRADPAKPEMEFTTVTKFLALAALPILAACAAPQTLDEYRPVVDGAGPAYEADLSQCRSIATQAEADYQKRQQQEMGANIVAGLLVGALVGQAVGGNGDWTAYGAAHGAAAGAVATDTELAHGGPRRIIDRCMAGRGHRVISDLGRG